MSDEKNLEGEPSPVDDDNMTMTSKENAQETQENKTIKRTEESENQEKDNFLLVTGFTSEISATDLKAFFRKFGKIGRIKVLTSTKGPDDSGSGRFAHVTVPSPEGLLKLVEATNGKVLKSCELVVSKAPDDGPHSRKYVLSHSNVPPPTPKKTDALETKNEKNDSTKSVPKRARLNNGKKDSIGKPKQKVNDMREKITTPDDTPETLKLTSTDNEWETISKPSQDDNSGKSFRDTSRRRNTNEPLGNRTRRRKPLSRRSSGEFETSSSSESSDFSHRRRRDSYQESKRSRHNSPVRRDGNRNRNVVHQVPRRYSPGGRNNRSRSISRDRRQRQSESPRQGGFRLMTLEEIKKAQVERKRKGNVNSEANYEERQRRRARSDSVEKEMDDRIDKELNFLITEREKLRLERKQVEREKLELLRWERERHQIEMEEIEKQKAEVRMVRLRMQEQETQGRYYPQKISDIDDFDRREKSYGKTIAERMVERERKGSREGRSGEEDDDYDRRVNRSRSGSSSRRTLIDQPSSKRELWIGSRQYAEGNRHDLRSSIEEKRKGYVSAALQEKEGDLEISQAVSVSYKSKTPSYHSGVHGSDYKSKQDSGVTSVGTVGVWDKTTSLMGIAKSDQWIRGGNGSHETGNGISPVDAQHTASIHSVRPQTQLYSYPGYPGIGILVSRTSAGGSTLGAAATLSTLYAGTTGSVDMSGIYKSAGYRRY